MHACISSRMRKRVKYEQKYIAIFATKKSPIYRSYNQSYTDSLLYSRLYLARYLILNATYPSSTYSIYFLLDRV